MHKSWKKNNLLKRSQIFHIILPRRDIARKLQFDDISCQTCMVGEVDLNLDAQSVTMTQ